MRPRRPPPAHRVGTCRCRFCRWLSPRIIRHGDLRQMLELDITVDTEARATWTRLGQ